MRRIHRPLLTTLVGEGSYTISGTVYDADGSTAVSGATVALGALSAVSAANGTYTISNIPPGTSGSMTCTKTGYSWTAITVAAMSGNLTSQNYTNAWWAAGGAAGAIGAYQSVGAASLAGSKVNLANPGTYDLLDGSAAPTWTANAGWTFTGSQWLRTGIAPDNNNWTVYVRVANLVASGGDTRCAIGGYNNSGLFIQTSVGNTTRQYTNGITGLEKTGVVTSAVLCIAGNTAYKDGVSEGTITTAAIASVQAFIGALSNNGTAQQFITGDVLAAGYFNSVHTSDIVGVITTRLAALP